MTSNASASTFWLALLSATLLSCGAASPLPPTASPSIDNSTITRRRPIPPVPPVTPSPNLVIKPELVAANTRFGLGLFTELTRSTPTQNVFISPLSVSIALGMTYNGATGATQQAMNKALSLETLDLGDFNQSTENLQTTLQQADPQVQLTIANSIWARQGVRFDSDFLARNQTYYQAKLSTLDFADPNAPKTINTWVKRQTQGKIASIVDRISPDDVMFLINAVYFKGKWSVPFDKAQTRSQPFTGPSGKPKNHPTMRQRGDYRYAENSDFQAVSLPYGESRRLSLYVFLPQEKQTLATLIQSLTPEKWQQWMQSFSQRNGEVELPRFKLEYNTDLKSPLSALGMGLAFTPQATFAKLSPSSTFIGQVKHKTFVEVNEEGTEAAAVTSVGITTTSAQIPRAPFRFVVDRPFLCVIRDQVTGAIVFMGAINSPE